MEPNKQEIAEIKEVLNDLSGKTEQELKPFGKLIDLLSQKIVGTDLSAEPQPKEFSKAKTEMRLIADEIANFNKYF